MNPETGKGPRLYVARWYLKRVGGRKVKFRKYLTGGASNGRHSWTADPTKAWSWTISCAVSPHELAEHYNCDVVRISEGI